MAAPDKLLTCPTQEDVLIREEFSDFTIVMANGQEVKCHKFMLAKASPVFRAMLKKDFLETKTNRMQMTEFDPETVQSFMDYIYADQEVVSEKITAELLRFS